MEFCKNLQKSLLNHVLLQPLAYEKLIKAMCVEGEAYTAEDM